VSPQSAAALQLQRLSYGSFAIGQLAEAQRIHPPPTHLCQPGVQQNALVVEGDTAVVLPQLVVRSTQEQQQVGAPRVARSIQLHSTTQHRTHVVSLLISALILPDRWTPAGLHAAAAGSRQGSPLTAWQSCTARS
jgi:hypothetical protein